MADKLNITVEVANVNGQKELVRTSVQKIDNSWIAGYFDIAGINSYVEDAKTKDELIHKLIVKILKLEGKK